MLDRGMNKDWNNEVLDVGDTVIVSKRNVHNEETWRYLGKVIEMGDHYLVLEAYFDQADVKFNDMLFRKGDRFVETYYADRWYNIFQIHAREDDHVRGWYCNIGFPAKLEGNTLSYIDLALDLLVFPDGRQILLDEDEFNQLDIPPTTRQKARQALEELKTHFKR